MTDKEKQGWEDKNADGILEGDEIDLANPFDAIDGEDQPAPPESVPFDPDLTKGDGEDLGPA